MKPLVDNNHFEQISNYLKAINHFKNVHSVLHDLPYTVV